MSKLALIIVTALAVVPKTALACTNGKIWPNGVIPYEIAEGVEDEYIEGYKEGFAQLNEILEGCLHFRPREEGDGYGIKLVPSGEGEWTTNIGMSAEQAYLGTAVYADYRATMYRELFHALGFYNEMSRPDRDEYIRIDFGKLQFSLQDQYKISDCWTMDLPFDYQSVMMYPGYKGNRDFKYSPDDWPMIKANCTRGPCDCYVDGGEDNTLSEIDIQKIKKLYYCDGEHPTCKTDPSFSFTPKEGKDGKNGRPCIFPFKYENVTYNYCTTFGGRNGVDAWCPTKVDAQGNFVAPNWGYCEPSCNTKLSLNAYKKCFTLRTGNHPKKSGTCEFPFTYRGQTYNSCTYAAAKAKNDIRDGSKLWCATKVNEEGVLTWDSDNWGVCNDVPICTTIPEQAAAAAAAAAGI